MMRLHFVTFLIIIYLAVDLSYDCYKSSIIVPMYFSLFGEQFTDTTSCKINSLYGNQDIGTTRNVLER